MIQRKNNHKKNISSNGIGMSSTERTKRTSCEKSKQKLIQKSLQNKMKRKMSFESPCQKDTDRAYKQQFSLLNYMIFKQKSLKQGGTISMKINDPSLNQTKKLNKQNFHIKEILGKGGFGRVMKVQDRKNGKIYAMKQMSKTVQLFGYSQEQQQKKRSLLSELKHHFLINMIYAFQDRLNLYLIMQYMSGGDLRYQIGRYEKFPQRIVKFFVCCILIGLQYLHSNYIIHRDIKPQNLVIDPKGYLRITDLGVASVHSPQNYKDTSGTPGYMAPEVINGQNHSFQVDFFALGVIAYQCMMGKRPYRGYSRQEIRDQILLYEASIKPHQVPADWSPEAISLINALLKRKPSQRIGSRGIEQIMNHPWFTDINWQKMINKKYPSPFIPNRNERNYDTVSQSEYDDETAQKMVENSLLLRKNSVQKLFNGYEYQQVKMF